MVKRRKVSIIGGGNVGTACAYQIALKELANVMVIDTPKRKDYVKGSLLEIIESAPLHGFDVDIEVSSDFKDIEQSDIIIVTAGFARQPGMNREDLIEKNWEIVVDIAEQIKVYAPHSIIVVVTNPLDAMVYTLWKVTGFPVAHVIGHSGSLDTSRYRTFIARELNVSSEDVHALIIGGHGDHMVPLIRFTTVSAIPVTELLSMDRIESCVKRAKQGGTEIVKLKGGSAFYTPGISITHMVESILKDKKRIIPCSVYCNQEYQVGGYFIGVPCILGKRGLERIIELELDEREKKLMNSSIDHIKKLVAIVTKLNTIAKPTVIDRL